jgi:ZIP family zinc transporter
LGCLWTDGVRRNGHKIPEGISVSGPIFYATGNRKKAFVYSLSSGLSRII